MTKFIWTIRIVAFSVATLFLAHLISDHDDHNHTKSTLGRHPAPLQLTSFDGKSWDTDKYAGKIRVINFWATWCPPCIQELPILNHLAKAYHNQVQFIGATIHSPAKEVAATTTKFRLAYPLAKVTSEETARWNAEHLPKTIILDSSGKVVWTHNGPVTKKLLEHQLDKLTSTPLRRLGGLLKESPINMGP